MIFNNFNYIVNPVTILFTGLIQLCKKKKRDFYKFDITAPKYILYDLKTIDNRLIASDNSLAKLEILKNYSIIGFEKGHILLQRNKGLLNNFKSRKVNIYKVKINNWIEIPSVLKNEIGWLSILKIEDNFVNKILGLLYKKPEYYIRLKFKNNVIKQFKIIPNITKGRFYYYSTY